MQGLLKSAALAALVVGASACSSSSSSMEYAQGTYTLQGVVANAVTGARIGGDLKLFLIQGPDIRGPTRLITDTSDPLVGEYAFTGIPADYAAGNKVYKVVAIGAGFERFEGEVTFLAHSSGTILDTVHSKIGNIYLFPTGTLTPSYTFTVSYSGKPVPNATVLLDPLVNNNDNTFVEGSALAASGGYVASLQATTGADGKATFTGSNLGLGAGYAVQVLPTQFTDSAGTVVQLGRTAGTNFVAGLAVTEQLVAMGDLTPTGGSIYVTSISNRPAGQLRSTGTLVVTFNAPVALVNPNGFAAVLTPGLNAAGTAAGTGVLNTATATTQPVIASLSADGLTLTLTPSYATPPAPTDRGVSIQYNNGTTLISPKDYPSAANTAQLFSLTLANLGAINGTVAITGP